MIVNEMFDTLVFLCAAFSAAFIIVGFVHLYYKYVRGIDFDSTY